MVYSINLTRAALYSRLDTLDCALALSTFNDAPSLNELQYYLGCSA